MTPESLKKYADKDSVERAIDQFATLDSPARQDLNYVKVIAQVERGLDQYRAAAKHMTVDELEDERHQSGLLARYLMVIGKPKPHPLCHAHAIISGAHRYAAELRAIMAWLKLRIDDPDNGCWLPENTAAMAQMPEELKNAIPHSRIHRYNYYFWLNSLIDPGITATQGQLRQILTTVAMRLQAGKQPDYVMNRKGEGLPI